MSTQEGMQQESVARSGARTVATGKPKRVRTGCLTCRERHLKCDEGLPTCMNCRKSGRECKRGVRLNFIDTQCQAPPFVPPVEDWNIAFQDDSREIASEYQDGLARYAVVDQDPTTHVDDSMNYEFSNGITNAPALAHQALPSIQGMAPGTDQADGNNNFFEEQRSQQPQHQPQDANSVPSHFRHPNMVVPPQQGYEQQNGQSQTQEDQQGPRDLLNSPEETLYMQVFVEEVGAWMDSMDNMKHFSRIMPFHALREPMLLNAFLACGSRHLTLVNPSGFLKEDNQALEYYDLASRLLLRALQNPNRDSVICATTAVILNIYEIMTEKALPRMNHIAGARALIKECGWSARSSGIGAACFWLNVGLETLSNLRFNWQSSWNPDEWGLELDLSLETLPGREESWTLRMLYIIAKINDFRATIPRARDASPHEEHMRRQQRLTEWYRLKQLTDAWDQNSPRTMKPMAYLQPWQNTSRSSFPDVWIIKRTSVVGRLLYHTGMVLLAQINPMATPSGSPHMPSNGMPSPSPADLTELERYHAHQICGIVAHVKDRGVASIALRCLHHAAECLTGRREQEEVLEILTRIHKETGWRINFIPEALMKRWGWPNHEINATLNGMSASANANAAVGGQYSTQQIQAAAAMAVANGGSGNGVGNINGMTSPSMASGPGLGLGSASSASSVASHGSPQYQFDQYAEVQNWKKNMHQRQVSHANQAPSNAINGAPSAGHPGGGAQTSPLQQQQQQQQQQSQAQAQNVPQGIVNPMFQSKLPPIWQGFYVSPVQQAQVHEARNGQGGGLGLSLEGAQPAQAYQTYG